MGKRKRFPPGESLGRKRYNQSTEGMKMESRNAKGVQKNQHECWRVAPRDLWCEDRKLSTNFHAALLSKQSMSDKTREGASAGLS